MPATTRAALAAAKKARKKRTGHISMINEDALEVVLNAFVNAQPNNIKTHIKRLATLRLINKNWAEVFAKRMYNNTAILLYTQRTTSGIYDDVDLMSRDDAMNSACALTMDSMGYLMYNQLSAYLEPLVCFRTLRLLMQFADAPNHAERLRLMGQGVGLPEAQVTESVEAFEGEQGPEDPQE